MTTRQPAGGDELWWADAPLRERLVRDPAEVLRERGFNAPPDLPRPILHEIVRILWLMWVDGEVVPLDRFRIDPADEGLLFGRGVWESTRTVNGVPWLWDAHLERMRRTADLLGITLAPERLPDAQAVRQYVRTLTAEQDVVIRLNATAGRPGKPGVVWMTAGLSPAPSAAIRLQTRRTAVLEDQPHLSWKTFHYAYRHRTGQDAQRDGFDTALLLDAADNLLEASHANLFVRFDDGWVTPSADGGLLLPGTVRAHLLRHAPVPIREAVIPKGRLAEVREAFVTNSNVGVVPVAQIDARALPVGDDTRAVARWLEGGRAG